MHHASPVRWCVRAPDAVERRVAHVDVGRRHVDLRPQRVGAVLELARAHPPEQIEVLRDRPVAVRALAPGLGQRAAVLAHFVGRQVVDVGQALLDELLGPADTAARSSPTRRYSRSSQSNPSQCTSSVIASTYSTSSLAGFVSSNRRLHLPAELQRDAEVQADRLRVADVQVAVRLGREARVHAPAVLPGLQIVGDDGPDEVERPGRFGRGACAGPRLGGHPVIVSC